MKLSILYVPYPTEEEAINAISVMLDKKLIACGNIYRSNSIYKWKGKVVNEPEYVAFVKTSSDKADVAMEKIKELHSYDTPCIIHKIATANQEYITWVHDCVKEI